MGQVLPRDPGARILQPDGGASVGLEHAPALLRPGGVLESILGQIGHHLLECLRVRPHRHPGLEVARFRRPLVGQAQFVERLVEKPVEHHWLAAGRLARFEAGERQQVVDQPGHPGAFLLHGGEGRLEGLRIDHGAPGEYVDVAGDRGQRGAKLVRGIRHEMAHLRFRLPADFEGLLNARGHLVEGDRQLADFIAGLRHRHPLLVIAGRQRPGRRGHLLQRTERPANDQRAQQSGDQEDEQ